ncbi:hypothetical protein [Nocardia asteroides]|uniref:hypothetical protein n=1 Tax=Nocardia asteroides TaxID=1824 RepID=UPI00343E50E0
MSLLAERCYSFGSNSPCSTESAPQQLQWDDCGVPLLWGSAVRWVEEDDTVGGFIEVRFTDADGAEHSVVDKLPVFFASVDDYVRHGSPYPVRCPIEVVLVDHLEEGRSTVDLRWSESTIGQHRFVVRAADLED